MSNSIIEAAKSIMPHLSRLLGEHAEPMRQQLKTALDTQKDEAQLEMDIIAILGEHEATRAWLSEKLSDGQEATKGGGSLDFSKLAGDPGDVKGEKYYKCRNSDCDYFDVKSADWEQIPRKCPKCGSAVIEDR